jgi:hypothetical protein
MHLGAAMIVSSRIDNAAQDVFDVLKEEFETLHGKIPDCQTTQGLYKKIHALDEPRAALCLSGGGIRSASFALGLIQGLARHGLLEKFHFLSTVSGGGYIGGWLSAWRSHRETTLDSVITALSTRQIDPPDEAPEIGGIRTNSNFLTPKMGLLSPDTWTGAALFVRNLMLNWLIFVPLFLGVLLVPIAAAEFVGWGRSWNSTAHSIVLALAAILYFLGLAASVGNRPGAGHGTIGQAGYLLKVLSPIYVGSMLLVLYAMSPYDMASIGDYMVGGIICGAAIYGAAFIAAYAWVKKLRGFRLIPTDDDPVPAPWLFVCWIIAGAVTGTLIGLGYGLWDQFDMWAMTRENFPLLGLTIPSTKVDDFLVVFGIGWMMLSFLISETVYVGLASYAKDGDLDREWLARSSGWFAAVTFIWGVFGAIVLFGPLVLAAISNWASESIAGLGGISGVVSVLIARSSKTGAGSAQREPESPIKSLAISVAMIVFLICLAIILADLGKTLLETLEQTLGFDYQPAERLGVTVAVAASLLLLSVVTSYFVNVNRFSLHALYRNRIIRAFLGSARGDKRNPDHFTGFDPDDNLPMSQLWTGGVALQRRLLHVVNITLNVVATKKLAWQERKAETFTVTPLSCGNPYVGYRKTTEYGSRKDGMTLGTAVAISGAAASPNQGYHSSPIVGLLMMLFNVRLGWWLGNPNNAKTSRQEGPTLGIVPVLAELFGTTTDDGSYVYLSDGGHFENLALYEMVRRRCRFIVVSDAGCDPDCALEDLGNATRKIWIDLGIRVTFEQIDVTARDQAPPPPRRVYCALGRIYYPEGGEPGYIVYVKPGFHGTEPADIRSYAAAHPTFPHETTADQWFSESQLESYRSLGSHIIDQICRGKGTAVLPSEECPKFDSLATFVDRTKEYLSTESLNL